MERKIGEIFECNGEWYQCVVAIDGCRECSFRAQDYCTRLSECFSDVRSDETSVVFKKLEKVGEPFSDKLFGLVQKYELKMYGYSTKDKRVCFADGYDVFIKPKQTKEDMEEKKSAMDFVVTPPRLTGDKPEHQLNLKSFDLQKAKEGKPVCTRDGRKARIICFDRKLFYRKVSYPILALVERPDGEDDVCGYNEKGKVLIEDGAEYKDDLMMLPEKKEGWVNVYKGGLLDTKSYPTKKEAFDKASLNDYVDTVKITWEE